MKVLALDPASVVVGWAVGEISPGAFRPHLEIMDAGKIQARQADPPLQRIDMLCDSVCALVSSLLTRDEGGIEVVIEVPSGKVHSARHGGGGAGLSVYGMAVGGIWVALSRICGANLIRRHAIKAEEWTAGTPKSKRRLVAKSLMPTYDSSRDSSGDIADAIALAEWWTVFRAHEVFISRSG